jgi:DNA-directed RNA polymerase subunit RPC12/RpoP
MGQNELFFDAGFFDWVNSSQDLQKIRKSEEEFKKMFPEQGKIADVKEIEKGAYKQGLFFIKKNSKKKVYVAYECPKCQKIVLGPPDVKGSMCPDMGLLEVNAFISYNCKNCGNEFYSESIDAEIEDVVNP